MASKLSLFLAELKRRKVVRVAAVYALVGLGVIEGASMILPTLQLEAAYNYLVILVLFGFPIALVLAWALEVTPQGIQKTADLTPEQLATQTPKKWRASTWILAGVSFVVVVGAGYLVAVRRGEEAVVGIDEHRVAVLPLENLSGDPSLDGLSLWAAEFITDGLVGTGLFKVTSFNEILASNDALSASGNPLSDLALAWPEETGATLAVLGSFSSIGDSVQFRLKVVDREATVLDAVDPVTGIANNPGEALGGLQVRAMSMVAKLLVPGHELAVSSIGRNPPHPDAHEEYLEGLRQIGWGGSNPTAEEHFKRALAIDPEYLNALFVLVPSLSNQGKHLEADSVCQILEDRSDDFLQQQRWMMQLECSEIPALEVQAAKRVAEIWPGLLYRVASHGTQANRPREVIEACSKYDPSQSWMMRNWAGGMWTLCSTALHMVGNYEGQLAFIEEKRESRPDTWQNSWRNQETYALIALGRLEEAEPIVEQRLSGLGFGVSPFSILNATALEYETHGHPDAARDLWSRLLQWLTSQDQEELEKQVNRRQRAETLLNLGRDEEALDLLIGLANEYPEGLNTRGQLGVARAKLGDRSGAQQTSDALAEMGQRGSEGLHTFYRASIAAHLDDLDQAVELLHQAIEEGFHVTLNLHRGQFLRPLRGYGPFEQLIAPKG